MTADEFETFDGAYALGALSAQDRELFETHLEGCDACLRRVSGLGPVLDLLALAPGSAFGDADADAVPAPATLLPRLLDRVRRERRRRRFAAVASIGSVAACLVALVAVLVVRDDDGPYTVPANASTLQNVAGVELSAQVQVVTHDRWDEVDLWCRYQAAGGAGGNYLAVAYTRAGGSAVIGSWPVIPGQTAIMRIPTAFRPGDITSVAILDSTGRVLSKGAV